MKSLMEIYDLESAEKVQLRLADEGFRSETEKVDEDGLEKFRIVVPEEDWEAASASIGRIVDELFPWKSDVSCPKCGSLRVTTDTADDDGTVSTIGYRKTCSECGYDWTQ